MDPKRFDLLARRLARVPRRHALRLLAGAVGPLVGLPGATRAEHHNDPTSAAGRPGAASCARLKKKCGQGKRCCGGLACNGGRCRCPAGRTAIDGRCAPPCNAACLASPICECLNVADDQTGDAPACLRRGAGDPCSIADLCRTDADCGADELCAKFACGDGFNRCLRLCGDPAVVPRAGR